MGKKGKTWNELSTGQKVALSGALSLAFIPLQPFYEMRNEALGQGKIGLQFVQSILLVYGLASFLDDVEMLED